jgi:hypothetical protein
MKKEIKEKRELPKEIRNFITEKLRRGWSIPAIQEEITNKFGLFVPRTFIFC